jgi:hypothetical protein
MERQLFLWLLIPLVLVSCSRATFFGDDAIAIEGFENEKKLIGTKLINEVYGYFDIACTEKYIVLFSRQREHLFCIYTLNGDSLGCFGNRGQGPNDMINTRYCGQKSDNNSLWITDVSNARLCALNIEQSLNEKQCVFDEVLTETPHSINAFICNDTLLISEQMQSDNYCLIITNILNQRIVSENKLYKYPSQNVFSTYKSIWRIHPDGEKMASAMYSINMINLLDLTDNSRKSLIINPPVKRLDEIVDKNTRLEKWTYYIDLDVTDEYIYALYCNQSQEDSYEVEKEMEVHVFDWQGNAIYKYIVSQYITAISVDEIQHCLYGLAENDERVYKYPL